MVLACIIFICFVFTTLTALFGRYRTCQCGHCRFDYNAIGTQYVDTRPKTKAGKPNMRYKEQGYNETTVLFTCKKCGGQHLDKLVG